MKGSSGRGVVPMAPESIRIRLVAILPGYGPFWECPENACARSANGSFTACGVFMDCAVYVQEHYETFSPGQLATLAAFLDECMTPPGTELGEAAAICFLEELAGERFSPKFQGYLSGNALAFFREFRWV